MTIERLRLRIVGLAHHQAEKFSAALEDGTLASTIHLTHDGMIPLELRPEPGNKNDPNAIEIFVDPAAINGASIKLGYVPRQSAPAIHVLLSTAGHLGAAIETSMINDPASHPMWRALIETDRPDLAGAKFSSKGSTPAPLWRNQAQSGQTQGDQVQDDLAAAPQYQPAPARPRPRIRKRLQHSWF